MRKELRRVMYACQLSKGGRSNHYVLQLALIKEIEKKRNIGSYRVSDSNTVDDGFLFQSSKESVIQFSLEKYASTATEHPHAFLLKPRKLFFLTSIYS